MKALRVHVERIVRPIRGGVLRKNKMREELLGHLMTAYAEEVKSAPTEKEAIARAARRLGEPDALRRELQATVPVWERAAHLPIPLPAPEIDDFNGMAPVKFAARFTATVLSWLVIGAPVLVAIGVIVHNTAGRAVLRPRPFDVHGMVSALPCVAGMVGLMGVALFVALLLFDRVGGRRIVSRASEKPAIMKACFITGLWVVAIGLFLAMAIPFGDYMKRDGVAPSDVFATLWTMAKPLALIWLVLPVAMLAFMTPALAFERRQYENWGSLDVEAEGEPRETA